MKQPGFSAKAAFLFCAALTAACSGRGNVDLSKATPLTAEPVPMPPGAGGGKPGGANDTTQYAALFSGQPGQWFSASVVGGLIDPVGTTLNDDFDGDGISNLVELQQNPLGTPYSNIWVADYPEIEADIAPPVTMKIEVLASTTHAATEINSDVTSDEVESRKNEGSEKFHQNELNERTVQYEREVSQSSSNSSSNSTSTSSSSASASASASGGGTFFAKGEANVKATVNITSETKNTSEHTFNQSSSERTQVFEDRPFKNNLDRSGFSVKADAAAKNARQYRDDKQTKTTGSRETRPDGGQIRAAMFIKNHSVNMPVRISNILCSLLFETPQGVLIPMESFRLRNEDFSLFEVSVYGGSEFGPYVVTLNNLNTVEIQNALALGYTPKIFIVDYEMRHVEDSNYRAALSSNFTGNNLKIIEENAKGRTALIKIMSPNFRKMFRVAAFEVERTNVAASEGCNMSTYTATPAKSPGISLRRALERISCSGIPLEFEHYVLDFTGTALEPTRPTVYMYGIKGINGLRNNIRCTDEVIGNLNLPASITGDPGSVLTATGQIKACKIRVAELTEDEIFSMGMWVVFDNGRFYKSNKYLKDLSMANANPDNRIRLFSSAPGEVLENCGTPRPENTTGQWCPTPIVQGIESRIWAGDNYDITYMKVSDLLNRVRNFGTTPLETGESVSLNTLWDKSQVGEYPYYPSVKSTFLGQAGLKDQIEFKVKLSNTRYLNPNFGTGVTTDNKITYKDFSYNLIPDSRTEKTKLFTLDEGVDIEISLGLNGSRADWKNIVRDMGSTARDFKDCGRSWNFQKQEYTICVKLPDNIDGVGLDGLVNVYMRTPLNNSYRAMIWPTPRSDIKRFDARLIDPVIRGGSSAPVLKVYAVAGALDTSAAVEFDTRIRITPNTVGTPQVGSDTADNVRISQVTYDGQMYLFTLSKSVSLYYNAGDSVSISSHNFTGQLLYPVGPTMPAANVLRVKPLNNSTMALGNVTSSIPITLPHGSSTASSSSSSSSSTSTSSSGGQSFDTFELKNIARYDHTYSITLQTSGVVQNVLQFDHKAGERVFADALKPSGSLLQPEVALVHDDGFQAAWNLGRPFGYGQLLESSSGITCPTIANYAPAFIGTHCAGYLPSAIAANWLGDDLSGELSLNNNWADGSGFSSFIYQVLNPLLAANNGKKLWLSYFNPFFFPLPNSENLLDAGNPSRVDFAVSGNRELIVWESYTNCTTNCIRGKIIDTRTGSALGGDFLISADNGAYNRYPQVSVHGSRALVIWKVEINSFTKHIYGRVVDLDLGRSLGSEFRINVTPAADTSFSSLLTSSFSAGIDRFQDVVLYQNRALVIWQSYENPYFRVRGRFVDLGINGAVTFPAVAGDGPGGEFFVSLDTNNASQSQPHIAISGNRALAIWGYQSNSGTVHSIRGRVFDIAAGTKSGTELTFNQIDAGFHNIGATFPFMDYFPRVAMSGNRALVVWESHEDLVGNIYTHDYVRGRVVDTSGGGSVLGSHFRLTAPQNGLRDARPWPSANGDKAIVVWETQYFGESFIQGQMIDFTNSASNYQDGNGFIVRNSTDILSNPVVANNGRHALVVWSQTILPNTNSLQARTIDVSSRAPVGSEFQFSEGTLFSQDNTIVENAPGNRILGVRGSNLSLSSKIYYSDSPYGLNNFFTAPLIERNYTVTSKIKF